MFVGPARTAYVFAVCLLSSVVKSPHIYPCWRSRTVHLALRLDMKRSRLGFALMRAKPSSQSSDDSRDRAQSRPTLVDCPMCAARVPFLSVNMHLDTCTGAKTPNASTSSGNSRTLSQPSPQVPSALATRGSGALRTSQKEVPAGRPSPGVMPQRSPTGKRQRTGALRVGSGAPLAERMRPCTLDELVGQTEALGPGSALRLMIEKGVSRMLCLARWGG